MDRRFRRLACLLTAVVVLLAAMPATTAPMARVSAAAPPAAAPAASPCPLGRVEVSRNATLTRTHAVMQSGNLVSTGGSFKEHGVDQPCDAGVTLGPFLLMGAGKLKAHIVGNPPVPNTWSLYNANTGMSIYYQPYYRGNFGRADQLLALGGQTDHNEQTGEAEWSRPGQLMVYIGAPRGAGPLSGACFAQGYSASVDVVEVRPVSDALSGDLVYAGDGIKTGAGGKGTTVQTSAGGLQSLGPNSSARFEQAGPLDNSLPEVPQYAAPLWRTLDAFVNGGYPMPEAYYRNPRGYLKMFSQSTLEEAYNLIQGETDPCAAALEAKLFLDSRQGEWNVEKVAGVGWDVVDIFLLPDQWDVLKWMAMGAAPPLVPLIGTLGDASDWESMSERTMELIREEMARSGRQKRYDAFTGSQGWTRAQTDQRIADVNASTEQLKADIKSLGAARDAKLQALQRDMQFRPGTNELLPVICWPPTLANMDFCATAHRAYADAEAEIEVDTQLQLLPLMNQVADNMLEVKTYETYRIPLLEHNCDPLRKPAVPQWRQGCASQTQLESGSLRQKGAGTVILGGNQVSALGTEFIAEQDGDVSRVKVVEGTVKITTKAGKQIQLGAGKQIELPQATVTDFDVKVDDGWPIDGLPLRDLVFDDQPQPYGPVEAAFAGNRVPADWVWEDPGHDVKLDTTAAGTLRVTVPNGNDLWDRTNTAPRLLHKVTGDFDLEGELLQECRGLDLATSQFLIYSPGSYLGQLANQMMVDGLLAHYRIIDSGWLRYQGQNKLVPLIRNWSVPANWRQGPDAPDKPIRLRLTRHGDLWTTYFSTDDGQTWNLTTREEILAPDTLWVGWLFKRVANDGLPQEPAVNTLRDVRLVTAPRDTLDQAAWDLDAWAGGAQADVEGPRPLLHFALDGVQRGQTAAYSTSRLEGDFDVAVTLDATGWPAQPDRARQLFVAAGTPDGKNMAYVRAMQNPGGGYRYDSDVRLDERWTGYEWIKAENPGGHLRLTRKGDKIAAYAWREGEWAAIGPARGGFKGAAYLELDLYDDGGQEPAPLKVDVTVERVAVGADIAQSPWQPANPSMFEAAELPTSLGLPADLTAVMLRSPFDLGNLFFDEDGAALIFSATRDRQKLIRLDAAGMARKYADSEVLAGLNGKAGVPLDSGILMTVDYWPDGGNRHGGFFQLQPDGTFKQWELPKDSGGLTDLIAAPQGGWYVSDFEKDSLSYVSGEDQPAQPLIAYEDIPRGLVRLAVDGSDGTLYALNASGDWPAEGTPGVYRITADGKAELVLQHPAGKNYGDIAYNRGGMFPAGLYLSDPASGSILRLEPDGTTTSAVTGLTNPAAMDFAPSGDLMVVCDAKYVLWCTSQAAAPRAPVAPPSGDVYTDNQASPGGAPPGEEMAPAEETSPSPADTPTVRPTATPKPKATVAKPTATTAARVVGRGGAAASAARTPTPTPSPTPTPTPLLNAASGAQGPGGK